MPRLHLFELADLPWFPRVFADAGTAYLRTLERLARAGDLFAPVVAGALARAETSRIVDLCSGGGGPVVDVAAKLRTEGREVSVVLSDLQPNTASLNALAGGGVSLHPAPVDASRVPRELEGVRTVFNAFHHFDDELGVAVLRDAVAARQPVVVGELSQRSARAVLSSLFIPLMVLLLMPIVRPVRLSWLLFTYVVPVLPFTIAWDGFVSHLRVRDPDELRALVARVDAPGWTWEVLEIPAPGGLTATALVGQPPT